MNKNLMIGLGVLAVAGIAYYMYKKPKTGSNVGTKSAEGETSSKFSNAKGMSDVGTADPLVSGRIKYGEITNLPKRCPKPSVLQQLPDGGYSCVTLID
jgi:hypothetical protein